MSEWAFKKGPFLPRQCRIPLIGCCNDSSCGEDGQLGEFLHVQPLIFRHFDMSICQKQSNPCLIYRFLLKAELEREGSLSCWVHIENGKIDWRLIKCTRVSIWQERGEFNCVKFLFSCFTGSSGSEVSSWKLAWGCDWWFCFVTMVYMNLSAEASPKLSNKTEFEYLLSSCIINPQYVCCVSGLPLKWNTR